jgi:hypothetical protein
MDPGGLADSSPLYDLAAGVRPIPSSHAVAFTMDLASKFGW